MDDYLTSTIVTGFTAANLPVRTVSFGGADFTDTNGPLLDFFVFEANGGTADAINIAAIFTDDSLGQNVAIGTPPWNNVGTTVGGSVQSGQQLAGFAFSITDLKDAAGANLSSSAVIKGIAITTGNGVDCAGIFAAVPPPAVFYDSLTVSANSSQVAGLPFPVTITAKDANGNTVNDSTLVVTVSSPTAGSLMEFDWNGDDIYGDNSGTLDGPPGAGVKTIQARNKLAQTVSITALQGIAITPLPPSITTAAGAFAQLQTLVPGETAAPGTGTGKTGVPFGQLQGVPFSVSVRAVDSFWNAVNSTDLIGITSSDSLATLPANASLVAGSASFSVTFNQAVEPYTVTATDLTNGSIASGVSSPITSTVSYRWLGDGTANTWDTTALNWVAPPSVTPVPFVNNGLAVFDEIGSASPELTIGTVSPTGVIVNSVTKNYVFQGSGLTGAATLTKAGASTLRLTVDNTYTGDTTVSGGLLSLESEFALPGGNGAIGGTSGLILNGGVLGLNSHDFYRALGTGPSNARLLGTNSGFAAFNGDKAVNLGGLAPASAVTWPSANFLPTASDVFVLGHPAATNTVTFENIIDFGSGGDRVFHVENGTADVDAILSGKLQDSSASPGNLVKTGAGALQLTSTANNYEGSTQIKNGRLIVTGAIYAVNASLPRAVTLGSGNMSGVLQLGDFSDSRNQSLGGLFVSGTGTANAVVGGNQFNYSTLTINNASGNVVYSGRLGGSGTYENNLSLTKALAGTLTLSGNSTYEGFTTISGGVLALGANNVLSNNTVTIANATLDVGSFSDTVGALVITSPNAKVNLGSGGTLAFADSRIEPWGANLINFTGSFVSGVSIRFGIDADGLDPAQLAQIRINGVAGSYGLSPTGYLLDGVVDPFLIWSGGATFDIDSNNDGVKNGLAWFLGAADKDVNANGLLPIVAQNAGALVMEFNCLDGASRGTSVFSAQYSNDLVSWAGTAVPGAVGSFAAGVVAFEVTDPAPAGGLLKVVATVPAGQAAAGKLFGRIKAEK
jgi:autotransporter-associated beta strand protein